MTVVLLTVTIASLALAGALLAYVARLKRQMREWSDARTAALAVRLAAAPALKPDLDRPSGGARGDDRPIAQEAPAVRADGPRASAPGEGAGRSGGMFELFGAPTWAGAHGRAQLVPMAGVLIGVLTLTTVYLATRPGPGAATAAAAPALELISLRHQREGETLTVAGLARNPASGDPLEGVTAVVLTYDRQGTFMGSAHGDLDFRQLAPGDESPFVVRMPGAPSIARYRVSFTNRGGTVPHFDRRGEAPAMLATGGPEED